MKRIGVVLLVVGAVTLWAAGCGGDDASCTPVCDGNECGDDGCGGQCGSCPDGKSYCNAGTCSAECGSDEGCTEPGLTVCLDETAYQICEQAVGGCYRWGQSKACEQGSVCINGGCVSSDGKCGDVKPMVEGMVKNNIADMDFTDEEVSIQLHHKLDIDEWEDGCISRYIVDFSKMGLGCKFHLEMETSDNAALAATSATLKADSFCPGWSDADEGEYVLAFSTLTLCSTVEVADYMTESACVPDVALGFGGVLSLVRTSDAKKLEVDLSGLKIKGDMTSSGDTELLCPVPCGGKECGDDGCGGSCGSCAADEICGGGGTCACKYSPCEESCCSQEEICFEEACCLADCTDKMCGDDGCGGSCGSCAADEICGGGGTCACKYSPCEEFCCSQEENCFEEACCLADCTDKMCGDDGCGGVCGTCGFTEQCVNGLCIGCEPNCLNKECGDNGCGGTCGSCSQGAQCHDGKCLYLWTDPTSGLMWVNPPSGGNKDWSAAKSYCQELNLGGYTDWRLPTIGELRTLIRGCPGTMTSGACKVTDSCLFASCFDMGACWSCSDGNGPAGGCYWPAEMQGTCSWYWSSSSPAGNGVVVAWYVDFSYGSVGSVVVGPVVDYGELVRCVR